MQRPARRCAVWLLLCGLWCAPVRAADMAVRAGHVGSEVPSFQMRTVAGPLMNRSICQVCRNGDRPVVMVLLREAGPRQRMLLRNLDRVLEERRGDGLRGFCVYLSDQPRWDISRVQTFAFNGRIEMPIGVTPNELGAVGRMDVPAESTATVFFYSDRIVQHRMDFTGDGPTHDEIREIVNRAEVLTAQDGSVAESGR